MVTKTYENNTIELSGSVKDLLEYEKKISV